MQKITVIQRPRHPWRTEHAKSPSFTKKKKRNIILLKNPHLTDPAAKYDEKGLQQGMQPKVLAILGPKSKYNEEGIQQRSITKAKRGGESNPRLPSCKKKLPESSPLPGFLSMDQVVMQSDTQVARIYMILPV